MTGIFINYRTGDGERAPELIDRELVSIFGKKRVFRDRRSIREGTEFPEKLRRELNSCTVLLAVIGRRWLDIRDAATDTRRIDMPNDYVHDEIRTALALKKIVIPVLLDASLPAAEDLPPDIAGLAIQQVAHLREGYSHHDLGLLTKRLRQHVPAKTRKRGAKKDRRSGDVMDLSNAKFKRSAVGNYSVYSEGAELRRRGRKDR
ncbi:toll/interleukin-1 receptor domain-containing protein [Strepomyces sp. STD 3.1]|uniref:toll/interleukin-1 receptor domain-containing protein n=1 Tax=Streptomyces sp. NPDC058985 TaxID=3346684 RepID=UPI001F3D3736|nr:toll/interleukin-1 receptor domain-containing protein [Streptomyces sp. STD 3.1]